jgi:hypothetical protein
MKLTVDNNNFEGNLPDNRIAMTIKSSAEMFSLLSDTIYQDKILAVIREYVCNAYDAHVSVGKQDVPFTVQLPNYLNSTFSVSDEGTGVDPEKIGEIFWTYGQSSKTNDQLTIGALGIGCKSAFAYTKSSFIVKNRYQGNEYTYLCFIDENGEPAGSMVGEAPTIEKNGITVEFATRPEDQSAFYIRFGRLFKHWANVKPNVIGVEAKDVFLGDPDKVIEGDQWYLEKNRYDKSSALAIMGNVTYPIDSGSIPNLPANLKLIADNPFVITFQLGDLRFTASRESLSYNEFTCNMVIKRLEDIRAELAKSFNDKVFKASKDIISFYKTFYKTFSDLRSTLHVNDHKATLDGTFAHLLIGKSIVDHVKFLGVKFLIDNLINCEYISETNDHQLFGLYSITERKNKIRLDAITTLSMTSTEELEYNQYYNATYSNKISIGTTIIKNLDWRSNYVSPRKERLDVVDNVLNTIDKFNVVTINKIKLDYLKKSLVFILNDVGSSGKDRIKALQSYDRLRETKLTDAQQIFVDFDPKVNDLKEVLKGLNSLVNNTLTGAEIKLLSALPDARPTIKQVKVSKEQVKVNVLNFKYNNMINTVTVGDEYFDYDQRIKLNIKRFEAQSSKKEILLINELSVKKAVPYVIKAGNNKKLYADTKLNISIINNMGLRTYSAHLGIFDELMVEIEQNGKDVKVMPVLIITKAMYEKLLKSSVKLVSLNDWVTDKITTMNDQEKFMDSIQRFAVLSKIKYIKGMYDGLYSEKLLSSTSAWKGDKSLFKSLFIEYVKLKEDLSKDALTFAKLEVMKLVKHTSFELVGKDAAELANQIAYRYQMLELVNYNSWYSTKLSNKIITYIEQIDSLIEQAVAETVEEISHHEIVEA